MNAENTKGNAEQRFRTTVKGLLERGIFPSPGRIRQEQGRPFLTTHESGGCNLNGKESRWRAEELTRAGYLLNVLGNGRWAHHTEAGI